MIVPVLCGNRCIVYYFIYMYLKLNKHFLFFFKKKRKLPILAYR